MNSDQLLNLLTWGLAGCAGGFIFLLTWIYNLSTEIQKRVTWTDLKSELTNIGKKLDVLNTSIVGDTEKPGMLTKLHQHEDRIRNVEEDLESLKP